MDIVVVHMEQEEGIERCSQVQIRVWIPIWML